MPSTETEQQLCQQLRIIDGPRNIVADCRLRMRGLKDHNEALLLSWRLSAIKYKDRIRTISAQRRKACPERSRRARQGDVQCSRKSANLRCVTIVHPT